MKWTSRFLAPVALACLAFHAQAQTRFPDGVLKIVVPFGPVVAWTTPPGWWHASCRPT